MENMDKREDYAFVIDFMPTGKSFSAKPEPLLQLLGSEQFTLLEAIPKPNMKFDIGEKVYIGKGERDKISLIKSRISYEDLTQTSKGNLRNVLSKIIEDNEQKYVDFFNNAKSLNIRQHSLELLPGIGKKHLQAIIKARTEKKFESFKDISDRVELLQDPAKLIVDRIIEEMNGNQRFYLFVKPFIKRNQTFSR
jgi:putative nucleotide binding protein